MHVYKYLAIGVHIDGKLNSRNHIDNVWKKVQQKHGILKKRHRHIMLETAILICQGDDCPHFDYGNYMIDSDIHAKIDKIKRIKDKVIRAIEYETPTMMYADDTLLTKEGATLHEYISHS